MDTLTCHGESLDVQGRNPGKLAVIAPMLERIKLEEIINQHVAEEFKIPLSELHYDPTHVLFEGAYNDAVKRDGVVREDGVRCNDTLEPAHITRGRGTDDAPQGARMIQVGLLTSELCGTCESSVQGAAGDSSVVSAFSEARGVAGVFDDDGIDDVLFAAAYVSSEHAGRCSSCGTEDDVGEDPEATTAAMTGWLNS